MPKLLTALLDYPHTALLKDGSISPQGYELEFAEIEGNLSKQLIEKNEFDVAEIAFSAYLAAPAHTMAFTAIPIFTFRDFPHRALVVNIETKITAPKQLEGRCVGARAYISTTGVWARGMLSKQYGVDLEKVAWVTSDEEQLFGCQLPNNVELIPGANLSAMVSSGELAAGVGAGFTDTMGTKPLVAERASKEQEWMARGIFPMTHVVVVKNSLFDKDPALAHKLFEAFVAAKAPVVERLSSDNNLSEEDRRLVSPGNLGGDPIPYGIDANRSTLEALVRFAHDQHILSTEIPIEEIFAPGSEG